jgi:CRP-like cAMP-binding protein
MPNRYKPKSNCLLSKLSAADLARLEPHLEAVDLPFGEVVYEASEELTHVHFPTTAIISLLYETQTGESSEVAIAGKHGLVGVPAYLGDTCTVGRAVVQSAGAGLRVSAERLRREFDTSAEMRDLLLRYVQAFITQISQSAVCNRLHSVSQRLCRWLLVNHDQLPGDRLAMTHDMIAHLLGVRREGVTIAAGNLQDLGAIKYSRGVLMILDRKKLEKAACECYEVVASEFDRLLGPLPRKRAGRTGK